MNSLRSLLYPRISVALHNNIIKNKIYNTANSGLVLQMWWYYIYTPCIYYIYRNVAMPEARGIAEECRSENNSVVFFNPFLLRLLARVSFFRSESTSPVRQATLFRSRGLIYTCQSIHAAGNIILYYIIYSCKYIYIIYLLHNFDRRRWVLRPMALYGNLYNIII